MNYGLRAAMVGPNWAAMRDLAREGDWLGRAIRASTGAAAVSDLQAGIAALRRARDYWTADGHPQEAARVQVVMDQLEGFAAEGAGLTGSGLQAWQAKLYRYQQTPQAAWALYLQASGEVEVAAVTAALVDAEQVGWVTAGAFAGAFFGGFAGAYIGAHLAERGMRRGR